MRELSTSVETPLTVIRQPRREALQSSIAGKIRTRLAVRGFLLGLVTVQSALLLTRLENTAFWIDEAMNALLAININRLGYPIVWDGSYLVEPYFNAELNEHLVRVSHTWLQYYQVALSFQLFGETAFAARLPSVACAVLCLIAVYFLALRISGSEQLAILAALLLTFHTGFLLYSRLARYFSLSFLFSILAFLSYLRWRDRPTRFNLVLFTVSLVILFYSHFIIWPFIVVTIIAYHFLAERRRGKRSTNRDFLVSIGVTVLTVIPWMVYANPLHHRIRDWYGSTYFQRLLVFFWKIDTWVFPFVTVSALLLMLMLLARLTGRSIQWPIRLRCEYLLLLWVPVYLFVIGAAPHPMMSSQYTSPAIPFAVIAGAFLLLRIASYARPIAAVTLALLLATNVLQAFPFIVIEKLAVPQAVASKVFVNPRAQFNAGTPLPHYLTEQLSLRSPLFEYGYFITHNYNHRLKAIISFLQQRGDRNQTVLAPWHDADAVRFYTGMNVVYHFKPSFTVEPVKNLVYREGVVPDWIIPNAYYEPEQPFFKFRPDDYVKVSINCPRDYIYENEPNLDFFIWRTNPKAPQTVFLLVRKALLTDARSD
jgi:hypothetical protein